MTRTSQRHDRIIELIATGEEDVDALAATLGVSASTVRRDLARLSRNGAITRTYGGAMLAPPLPEQALSIRERTNRQLKDTIAHAALDLVADGDTLLLDAGSTVAAFGRLLAGRKVRVVTSNLPLVPVLVQSGIEVVVLGGAVRPISMGVVGPLAQMTLSRLTVDKAFLGADGVVAGRGLCEAQPEQCALKELMMAQAGAVAVLADHTKLGRASQQYWAHIPGHWTLVTDQHASEDTLAPFRRLASVHILEGARVSDLSHLRGGASV